MSVTAQIIFPYMSDARTPAMDVQRTTQHVCKVRSFQVFLSAMLIVNNGSLPSGLGPEAWKAKVEFEFSVGLLLDGRRQQCLNPSVYSK